MITNSGFSEGQRAHLEYLASLPTEAKCRCGWDARGECFNCRPEDGGRIPCGAGRGPSGRVLCVLKRGHDGDHVGFERNGAGAVGVRWVAGETGGGQ